MRSERPKCDYDSQASVPEGRPGDVVCLDDGSSTLVLEPLTIIELADVRVSKRVPTFVNELGEVLLHVAKHGGGRNTLQIMPVPASTIFEMNILVCIKNLPDSHTVTARNTRQLIKKYGLRTVLL